MSRLRRGMRQAAAGLSACRPLLAAGPGCHKSAARRDVGAAPRHVRSGVLCAARKLALCGVPPNRVISGAEGRVARGAGPRGDAWGRVECLLRLMYVRVSASRQLQLPRAFGTSSGTSASVCGAGSGRHPTLRPRPASQVPPATRYPALAAYDRFH